VFILRLEAYLGVSMFYSCYATFVYFIKVGGFSLSFDVLKLLGYIPVLINVGSFSWSFDILQLLG